MRYRLSCRYRQWIGKPDPSGFGTFTVESEDPSWLQQHGQELTLKGHKVLRTEKLEDGKWVRI